MVVEGMLLIFFQSFWIFVNIMAVSRHNLPQLCDEAIVGSDAGSLVPDQPVGLAVAVLPGGHQEGDYPRGGPAPELSMNLRD